jgi:hypothetical protein
MPKGTSQWNCLPRTRPSTLGFAEETMHAVQALQPTYDQFLFAEKTSHLSRVQSGSCQLIPKAVVTYCSPTRASIKMTRSDTEPMTKGTHIHSVQRQQR